MKFTGRRDVLLTYVVNESCIRCKYMDCVEVCPVDCFYEGENMLVIHPDECIDCGVCVPDRAPEGAVAIAGALTRYRKASHETQRGCGHITRHNTFRQQ